MSNFATHPKSQQTSDTLVETLPIKKEIIKMGPFDREILDYVDASATDSCSLDELFEYLKGIQDYDTERAENDITNLIHDGLLILDEEGNSIHLTDKAKRPVVPLPKNQHK